MTKDQVRVLRTNLISLTALWHIYYCPYFRNEKLEMWNTLPKITQLLLSHFSHVWLCVTPETAAHQAPSSLGSSRQEHWSGLPFHPPGDLPNPGIKPCLLYLRHWQADSLPLSHLGSLWLMSVIENEILLYQLVLNNCHIHIETYLSGLMIG